MYKRVSRFSKGPKKPYSVWSLHSDDRSPTWDNRELRVGSIDPAIKNYAVRVETWKICDRNVQERSMEYFSKSDLTIGSEEDPTLVYKNLSQLLTTILPLLITCQFVIVECQMAINTEITRISQHTITEICVRVQNKGVCCLVLEMDSRLKTRLLGVPPKIRGQTLKKWTIDTAIQLFRQENDDISIEFIMSQKKKDDLADVKCQLRATEILFCTGRLPKIY